MWDSLLIKARFFDWGSCVTKLVDTWMPGKDFAELAKGTPIEWALEAHKIAAEVASPRWNRVTSSAERTSRSRPRWWTKQLALAGIRLGRILNAAPK